MDKLLIKDRLRKYMELSITRSEQIRKLVIAIKKAKKAYDEGNSTLSDQDYDLLEEELRKLDPENSELLTTRAPSKRRTSYRLPYPMFSLDKIKTGKELSSWINNHPGPYLVSPKLDGVSLEVVGKDVYTHSAGSKTGQRVNHLFPHLNIPQDNEFALRGEVLIPISTFKKYSKDGGGKYSSPRNLVAGIVNKLEKHEGIKDIRFIVHEVLDPRGVPSTQLSNLKNKGYIVVPYKVIKNLDETELNNYLSELRSKNPFEIDGLVIVQNRKTPVSEDSNPEHAIAYKPSSMEKTIQTKVVQVIYQESSHGYLKPRIEVVPVKLSGATITYCTGHNAGTIRDKRIGPGAIVEIKRSGEVIPYLEKVIKPAIPQLPDADLDWVWSKNKVDAVLKNPSGSSAVMIKKLCKFMSTIKAFGISKGIIQKLYQNGYDDIFKIINITQIQLMKIPGIQKTSAINFRRELNKALQEADLPILMDASGLFGRIIGERRIRAVQVKYPDLLGLIDKKNILQLIMDVPGFSTITAKAFVQGLHSFIPFYRKFPIKINTTVMPKTKSRLMNKTITFSGIRDANLSTKIIANGGNINNNFTNSTTILLVKDKSDTSSKIQKARQKGIPILTIPEFISLYKIK